MNRYLFAALIGLILVVAELVARAEAPLERISVDSWRPAPAVASVPPLDVSAASWRPKPAVAAKPPAAAPAPVPRQPIMTYYYYPPTCVGRFCR